MKSNGEWRISITHIQRALSKGLSVTMTENDLKECIEFFEYKCAYCGKVNKSDLLHQESVVPFSMGGGYERNNIVPSCKSCNSHKTDLNVEVWYREYPFFTQERFDKIHEWTKYSEQNDDKGKSFHDEIFLEALGKYECWTDAIDGESRKTRRILTYLALYKPETLIENLKNRYIYLLNYRDR